MEAEEPPHLVSAASMDTSTTQGVRRLHARFKAEDVIPPAIQRQFPGGGATSSADVWDVNADANVFNTDLSYL